VSDRTPVWQQRFRAPVIGTPTWSRHTPDRVAFASSESGSYQVHAWDVRSGERHRISDEPVGVIAGAVSADGGWLVWHRDTTGDESGTFVTAPFGGGAAEPLFEGLPDGWDGGIALGRERIVAAINDRDGFAVYVSEGGMPARRLLASPESIELGGSNAMVGGGTELGALSADETLLAIEHAETGDLLHQALRVVDARTGATTADLHDEGLAIIAFAWSPIPGDPRLAVGHERRGERRPAIWNVATGELRELDLPWDHLTDVTDWWPDGSSLLLAELREGRHVLHRYDLETDELSTLSSEPGSIGGARVRPDGRVWYRLANGLRPGAVMEQGRREPLLAAGGAPPGRPFRPWQFANPHGQTVHGWRIEPDAPGPWPTLMFIHGGPTSVDLDRWSPEAQAYVDAGFQVAMVNYRGSIGFGAAWRDTLIRNIGWPEVEDILAGLDDLVARGWTDPRRAVIGGWSWGGYLTLLMHGMHPDRFIAGVAGVPVGDYEAAYADESPMLQAYDRALFDGPPSDVPDLLRERSPMTYVDRVTAPLLILAGEQDSRCPIRQVLNYTDRLAARGHDHELYLFPSGHAPLQIDERIRQTGVVLDFLARRVPGITRLPGLAR
jgi:dipeptidyl aminopeptidase/acylaminoacyl peptidase